MDSEAKAEKERAEKLELLNNAVLSLHSAGITIMQIAHPLNTNDAIVNEKLIRSKN